MPKPQTNGLILPPDHLFLGLQTFRFACNQGHDIGGTASGKDDCGSSEGFATQSRSRRAQLMGESSLRFSELRCTTVPASSCISGMDAASMVLVVGMISRCLLMEPAACVQ